jgi:aminoglycoside phosphotransferase (APT) family kinase protein
VSDASSPPEGSPGPVGGEGVGLEGETRQSHGLQSSTRDPEELGASLQAWLRLEAPKAEVTSLEIPEHTGMSSLSVMVEVAGASGTGPQRLVARLAPDESAVPVFPDYDLEKQYLVLEHLGRHSSVPVPRVRKLELDPDHLGVPFFLMDRIDGLIPPDVMPYPFGSWLSEAARGDQRRLQEAALGMLASVHGVSLPDDLAARLEFATSGGTTLERHVASQRAYYEWSASDGARSSVLEAGFEWLDGNWPSVADDDRTLSWGDARIGNMIFRDFLPVALLDWEMVGLAPIGVDLGWMIYLHRWFDDIAATFGIEPMSHFMRVPEAVASYEAAAGVPVGDLRWYLFYAALRHGIVMFRIARRPIAFGQGVMPDDPNDLIMHRATLEAMLSGEYWAGFVD